MKTLVLTIRIEPRQGVVVPSPRDILLLLRNRLQREIIGMQRFTDTRSMTALNATVHEMVNVEMEVKEDAAATKG